MGNIAAERPAGPGVRAIRSRTKTFLLRALAVIVALLIAGELIARYWVGLGDPVLLIADPEIEYRVVPSSQYQRMGHSLHFNQWSMRSVDFPQAKTDPDELRILAIGDSILSGGWRTDQDQIATSCLQRSLREALQRPVTVGNVSCNSWGPPNQLAYVKKFGWFDADIVILVFNSEDVADVPTFAPLDSDLTIKPLFALQEVFRLAMPKARSLFFSQPQVEPRSAAQEDAATAQSLAAIGELVQQAQRHGAEVIAIQHHRQSEFGLPPRGQALIAQTLRELGIEPLQSPADPKQAANLYFDDLHMNADGQHALGQLMADAVKRILNQPRD